MKIEENYQKLTVKLGSQRTKQQLDRIDYDLKEGRGTKRLQKPMEKEKHYLSENKGEAKHRGDRQRRLSILLMRGLGEEARRAEGLAFVMS